MNDRTDSNQIHERAVTALLAHQSLTEEFNLISDCKWFIFASS